MPRLGAGLCESSVCDRARERLTRAFVKSRVAAPRVSHRPSIASCRRRACLADTTVSVWKHSNKRLFHSHKWRAKFRYEMFSKLAWYIPPADGIDFCTALFSHTGKMCHSAFWVSSDVKALLQQHDKQHKNSYSSPAKQAAYEDGIIKLLSFKH